MSLGITITVDSKDARQKLQRLVNLINVRELLQAIGNRHVRWMVDNLRGAGIEQKHKTMAPSTILARPKRTSDNHFSSRWQGRLAQSFVARVIGRDAVSAGTEDEFAAFHHFGTNPHVIRPTQAKYLKFRMPDGTVFTKEVKHPGIPARPLLPTKKTAEKLAHDILNTIYDLKVKQAGVT